MSKEKQCECCHEWWYGIDVKENLCPNCYDYFKQLKQQLAEKDKEIEKLKQQYTILDNENGKLTTELIMGKYKKAQKEVSFGIQLAIQELEKVNEILTDTIIKVTQDEMDLNKLCYLEEISAQFCEKMQDQIKKLKGE